ncbi:glycoside hydrolase superfamily [Collybia nuda]|uniref:Glycoside hydrolase superfamily n=1 Tax=Collybia nuda TaxID=64659 RepID=A0A9P5Y0Z5_9AGAR|nr:glycoside hydrolase superfamily [Collybia nuda]
MAGPKKTLLISTLVSSLLALRASGENVFGVRDGLHFDIESRAVNKDGSAPTYKNPKASIEARVNDLLPRMSLEEKVAQLIQGDLNGWMDLRDPLDNTLTYNQTGLQEMMRLKGGSIWGGYLVPWEKFVFAVNVGQKYLMENTTLGIPALIQSEGLHGFTNNGTIFPSPIGLAASFDTDLISKVAGVTSAEAEGLGINHIFAPVLDLARELRWGRVEEGFGEDPYLTGEIGHAFVTGLQSGRRRNASSTAIAEMAATCKHFAAFGSPQSGLNLAQVSGGERELRTTYLRPFNRACLESLSIMTAYSSYDGIAAVANTHLLTDILRTEWGYKYWVTSDAGAVDLLINLHNTCDTRECAAKAAVENMSGEMGGGTYTFLTLTDQVKAGKVNVKYIDATVKSLLRTKFALGLFENPYPYGDYLSTLRTPASRTVVHDADAESIVLLENRQNTLPLSPSIGSIALIGPQSNRVSFGDYVFSGAVDNGITPLDGFKQHLESIKSSTRVNFAEGCKLWSNDESGIPAAVEAAKSSDVAIVMVGTWSLDQTLLWTPGTNATTGEHNDMSDLGLVGAQLELVKAVKAAGKPTIVVFVSGKPTAEPWIQEREEDADAVIQQFYPGELGGLALAEIIFGAVNPSGKLPVSFPRHVGTTPIFYNYLKGSRPSDPGRILDDGTLQFGHAYVLDSPAPLWSFGHGLSYTTFNYTDLKLSSSTIGRNQNFDVTVTVHNTGNVAGKEVVQVYATDLISSVVVPNQDLIGFKKVDIPAGGSVTVKIPILSSSLALWSLRNTWVVEPGNFNIKVGTSDQAFAQTTLTVR